MYVIEDNGGAVALMIAALLLLGTWPAVLTLLERRGRLPQHTYLDYSITNLLAAVLIALTFGQIGDESPNQPNFFTQLSQDSWPSMLFAMAGGLVLNLGNLSTQYAWAYVGLSITQVISCSIAVVLGTTINYFLDGRINKAEILFVGVGCFLIAVGLGSAVHSSNEADNKYKLSGYANGINHENTGAFGLDPFGSGRVNSESVCGVLGDYSNESNQIKKDVVDDIEIGSNYQSNSKARKSKAGTAKYLLEIEEKRSIKVFGSNKFVGLALVFFAGLCYSLFSPAFNLATNDQWHTLQKGVPHLVVYTAFFYFSISCFAFAIALNVWLLYRPVLGIPASSIMAYVRDWRGRQWALLAGLICGFGNGFQFMGGQAAGYAAANAVQALPLVSIFWGIVLFGEYRKSSKKTYMLLSIMLAMFIVAVVFLMASSGRRNS